MSYVEYLRKQRESYAAGWISFIHAYRPAANECYTFFEGFEDVAFFMPELRRRSNAFGEMRSFICKGKENVLRLVPIVRRRLDKPWRALFFVDKDIDDLLGIERATKGDPFVFQTSCYSVENYLVSEVMLESIWTDILQLPDAGPAKGQALALYRRVQGQAVRSLRVVMAWVIYHRSKGRKPNLNNVSLARLYDVRLGSLKSRRGRSGELDAMCSVETPLPCWRSILSVARRLRGIEPKAYMRGKFEMWIFARLLERVVAAAQVGGPLWAGRVPATAISVTASNAVTVLAGRTPAPSDLARFLDLAASVAESDRR